MKIGFDAKRFFFNHSGLGNYSRNIISYLCEEYPNNMNFLFTPNKKNKLNISLNNNSKTISPGKTNPIFNSWWRTKGILKDPFFKQLDIYHGLSNELPIGIDKSKTKSIVTIHDLIFVRYPHLYKKIDRAIYLWKMKRACTQADKIIAISTQTKNDIIEFLKINPNKIETVYQGCNDIYIDKVSTEQRNKIKSKYNLPENYILSVGTIEDRKNTFRIVKALHEHNIDFPLVLVGKSRPYTEQIRTYIAKNKLENKIFIINNVEFLDLPAIYQNATIFIYPSIFEGFGIPIIEAFNSDIPVIVSNIDVFEEVAADAAVFVDPYNTNNIAEAIQNLLNNKTLQTKYINAGRERAKFFSGKKIATDMMTVYSKI